MDKGKAACKAALQEAMGLPVRPEVPLIGFIGRLDQQKGADLILGAMHWLASQDVQVVLLGSGRKDLEDGFKWAESTFRDKVGFQWNSYRDLSGFLDLASETPMLPNDSCHWPPNG